VTRQERICWSEVAVSESAPPSPPSGMISRRPSVRRTPTWRRETSKLLPNGWREAASLQQVTPAAMASDRAASVALSASRDAAVPAWSPMRPTIKTLWVGRGELQPELQPIRLDGAERDGDYLLCGARSRRHGGGQRRRPVVDHCRLRRRPPGAGSGGSIGLWQTIVPVATKRLFATTMRQFGRGGAKGRWAPD
jgi:hypothetical protein